ncbi:MAG: hypothetical protein B6D62_01700 [Candidatus Cloacimonas sp. 4484_275]|nr:MAG: hypothetical protein B6D62_01700 [Candidatus Cloacimonas sp. 4484_275]
MKKFREELERRKNERRKKRSSTWIGLIIRILILAFVIMIMKTLGTPVAKKTTDILFSGDSVGVLEKGK